MIQNILYHLRPVLRGFLIGIVTLQAAVAFLASCGRFDPAGHVFPNSIYLDVSQTDQEQIANFQTGWRQPPVSFR